MRVSALDPSNPQSMKRVLTRAGIDPVRVDALIHGSTSAGLFVSGLDPNTIDDLLFAARDNAVDALSGDDWVLVIGTFAHLAGLTRPGHTDLSEALTDGLAAPLRGLTEPEAGWQIRGATLELDKPVIVGIVNVTPDSFSDGGEFLDPASAAARAVALVEEGADIVELGAHSTRPGATAVDAEAEWDRLGPALAAVVEQVTHPIAIDTFSSVVARRAIDAGAVIINDVSALRFDPEIATVCADTGAGLVLMHSRGPVESMSSYDHTNYDDVVFDVVRELGTAAASALEAGVAAESIVVDPGLGFGKTGVQSREILSRLSDFAPLGFPVMVGPSRKRFVRELVGDDPTVVDDASAQLCGFAMPGGARLFRMHRADLCRRATDLVRALQES